MCTGRHCAKHRQPTARQAYRQRVRLLEERALVRALAPTGTDFSRIRTGGKITASSVTVGHHMDCLYPNRCVGECREVMG